MEGGEMFFSTFFLYFTYPSIPNSILKTGSVLTLGL
jgi:hypothetical protein